MDPLQSGPSHAHGITPHIAKRAVRFNCQAIPSEAYDALRRLSISLSLRPTEHYRVLSTHDFAGYVVDRVVWWLAGIRGPI